jgi:hypothetical protein
MTCFIRSYTARERSNIIDILIFLVVRQEVDQNRKICLDISRMQLHGLEGKKRDHHMTFYFMH